MQIVTLATALPAVKLGASGPGRYVRTVNGDSASSADLWSSVHHYIWSCRAQITDLLSADWLCQHPPLFKGGVSTF